MKFSRFIASIIVLITSIPMFSQVSKPDFAYPQKVSLQSKTRLKSALKTDNGPLIVRSLINLELAQAAISSDSIPAVLNLIDSVCSNETNECTKALLQLFIAQTYASIYESNRYNYDARQQPLLPLPDDYNLWSGEQFRAEISRRANEALSSPESLKRESLKKYSTVVSADAMTLIYYPTLYDFVANSTISLLRELNPIGSLFPMWRLCDYAKFISTSRFVAGSNVATNILNIYSDLLEFHKNDTAPFINTDIERINFISQYIFSSDYEKVESVKQNLLKDLYNRYAASEYSSDALIALSGSSKADGDAWLYEKAKHNISAFPTYKRINCLKNIIANIGEQTISLDVPEIVSPSKEFKVKVNASNFKNVKLSVYRLPNTLSYDRYYQFNPLKATAPISSKSISFAGKTPFRADTTISISIPQAGYYIIVPSSPDKPTNEIRSYPKIYCSDLAICTTRFNELNALVINPLTGKPIDGAEIKLISNRSAESPRSLTHTDHNGFAKLDIAKGGRIFAIKGSDRYSLPIYAYNYNDQYNLKQFTSKAFTDLAIYHPGDSVKWSMVAYSYIGNNRNVEPDKLIKASLHNANQQVVDTITATTDEFGRISGTFSIPQGELTGYYSINFEMTSGAETQHIGSTGFMVSDYKLPTYHVDVENVCMNDPTKPIDITVKARAYSGIPMTGARAVMNLSVSQRYWWRMSNSVSIYTDTTTIDANGVAHILVPREIINQSPAPDGLFTAQIVVTSLNGETQQGSTSFSIVKTMRISASMPGDINVTNPVKLDVKVINPSNETVDTSVNYDITKNGKSVMSGSVNTSNPVVYWKSVPGGNYTISFSLPDNGADTVSIDNIGIYRPSDNMPPKDTPVWVPVNSYNVESSADILYGTSADEAHILYTLWTADKICEQRWIVNSPGMHTLKASLPEGVDEANVTLLCTNNFQSSTKEIKIHRKSSEKGIKITVSSFRDHITPSAEETWTFHVKALDGSGVTSAMVLDMYNKALDNLAYSSFEFSPRSGASRRFNVSSARFSTTHAYFSIPYKHLSCKSSSTPSFDTYGQRLFGARFRHFLTAGYGKALSVKRAEAESEDEIEAVADEEVSMSVNAVAGSYDEVSNMAEHKMRTETEEASTDADNGESGNSGTSGKNDFSYRDSNVPLAFFRPMLTTDANGNLTFTFTVPNANATWRFNATAFTADLLTSNYSADVLANKPIMVQPNMPRFLRYGDTTSIEAIVANNSDTPQTVTTTVEIFNTSTLVTTGLKTYTNEILPGGNATISTDFTAPTDCSFVGYRIKSSTESFADGEQNIIPVLPSSSPIIETRPFYLHAGNHSASVSLPEMPENARVTLQFCNNPVWYVVTALPGLQNSEMRSSIDAAQTLFSTAVAKGILKKYPAVKEAIRQWTSSDKSDSTLVSMLNRNSDLKTMLLKATPWVMDAASDNERMERLALLFDGKEMDNSLKASITLLKKLQREDGGLAWIDESPEASEWATYYSLSVLGQLNRLGFMPDDSDLKTIVNRCLNYIAKIEKARYHKYPKSDFTSFVKLIDAWPGFKYDNTTASIINITVQRIVKNWKSFSLTGKSDAAMILYRHSYRNVAKTILTSLREYAVTSPEEGMTWPSINESIGGTMSQLIATTNILEAFRTIEPESADIAKITQWLILQKEARNWGNSSSASSIIASILESSSEAIVNPDAGATYFKLNGKQIPVPASDDLTGYFRMPLQNASNATLEVTSVDTPSPSWGAVYGMYTKDMENVAPDGNATLSIEKNMYKKDGTGWSDAVGLKVGDIVIIELTVKSSRDIQYVTINDERPAMLEPTEQTPAPIYSEGICFYRENRDSSTNFFISNLPKGVYKLRYEMTVNNAGSYASGIATIQSQYAPELSAHSGGTRITTTTLGL